MIVVDNSILVSAIIDTNKSPAARRVTAGDKRWILPPLWKFEFTNVIATLVRARNLDTQIARSALDEARILVTGREIPVDQIHVLRLSVIHAISGYDAQYVALAEDYGIKCITADRELAKRAPGLVVLLEEFAAN